MSRRSTCTAARIEAAPANPQGGKRISTTLGELIAAAYDAVGPAGSREDVARLLRRSDLGDALRPLVQFD